MTRTCPGFPRLAQDGKEGVDWFLTLSDNQLEKVAAFSLPAADRDPPLTHVFATWQRPTGEIFRHPTDLASLHITAAWPWATSHESRGRMPSPGSTRSSCAATCSTRSSGSTGPLRAQRRSAASFARSHPRRDRGDRRPGSARTFGSKAPGRSAPGSSSTASCSSSLRSRAVAIGGHWEGSPARAGGADRQPHYVVSASSTASSNASAWPSAQTASASAPRASRALPM